ncbi:unnamed protein product [Urochloa humidicola]
MDHRWLPGAWGERPGRVHAGVARSEAIRGVESELETFSLLAVQIDARVRLDAQMVRQAAVKQLRVPVYEVGVSRLSTAAFLIRFGTQQQRDAAYRCKELHIGHTKLHIMAWKRQFSSKGMSKFFYHARVCIEGVPFHARHAEAVAGLFKAPTIIDDLDCDAEKPEEEECLRLWLWTADPDAIPISGVLHIEEPVTLPEPNYAESLVELGMPMGAMRAGAAEALEFEVLIHVDRVLDYSAPPANPSYRYPDSPISGHPDVPEEEWPVSHPFHWRLGVPDGEVRTGEQRRISVHDRLGDRGRDRSPPRGGAGGAAHLGLRQMTPSGPHDLQGHYGSCSYHHGSSSSHGGGGRFTRREMQWRVKADHRLLGRSNVFSRLGKVDLEIEEGRSRGKDTELGQCASGDSFQFDAILDLGQRTVDPMVEEANRHGLTNVQQCSVEPTAAYKVQAVPDCPKDANDAAAQANTHADLGMFEEDLYMAHPPPHDSAEHANQSTVPSRPESDGHHDGLLGATDELDHGFDLGHLLDGLPFDLNQAVPFPPPPATGLQVLAPATATVCDNTPRVVLGTAEARLNKDEKDKAGPKSAVRFAVPLKKALLCNPMARSKSSGTKKQLQNESVLKERKKANRGTGKKINLPIDEQATVLLMKAAGVITEDAQLTEEAQQQFGETFTEPLLDKPVRDIRIALGLPGDGRVDALGVLVSEAGVADD